MENIFSNFLNDKDFLKDLSQQKNRIIYTRINLLNINNDIIDSIEGQITQGSINISGTSAVQRTCSLSLISNDLDFEISLP